VSETKEMEKEKIVASFRERIVSDLPNKTQFDEAKLHEVLSTYLIFFSSFVDSYYFLVFCFIGFDSFTNSKEKTATRFYSKTKA
jgi:hypothetical protein